MVTDLQKAGLWKRISAGLFDFILLTMLAAGVAALLSWVLNTDAHYEGYMDAYSRCEQQYGIQFQIDQATFEAMTPEQKESYDTAYQALLQDQEAMYHYNMILNMSLLIITFSILLGVLALEFAVPLWLKNGQTLGKKIFGVALMRSDGVKLTSLQLFVRTVLGKFTLELMIPVYIVLMVLFNAIGIIAAVILGAILVAELLSLVLSKNGSLLHDVIAGTVAVDMASQRIFESNEEKLEYIKKLHAEQSARQEY